MRRYGVLKVIVISVALTSSLLLREARAGLNDQLPEGAEAVDAFVAAAVEEVRTRRAAAPAELQST